MHKHFQISKDKSPVIYISLTDRELRGQGGYKSPTFKAEREQIYKKL